uniref:Four helix bundle protein n=1 Tax=candidate division WOR-3 bacterium TaxID=2052148 RepID=A0A7C6EA02_UNCW3
MKRAEDLDVFKLSHKLTLEIYKITEKFSASERFGLISQMRRAAASIPMNLMEGAYRMSRKEFQHFVSIAKGSCGEIRYQLLLAKDLQYLKEDNYEELESSYERISMMLTKLYKSL